MKDKIEPCDICGMEYTKERCKIGKHLSKDNLPCYCNIIKQIEKLKKKTKSQKEEISNMNILLMEADESGWDQEGLYEDAFTGTFNGNNIGSSPDKKYAKWLTERYGLNIDKEGDIIRDK